MDKYNTTPIPKAEIKRCSKCGKGVLLGFYVERKRLFSSKTKKWCFSCYNKLKFSAGKLELKEVIITGEKDDFISVGRVPIPKEDSPEYTKFTDVGDL